MFEFALREGSRKLQNLRNSMKLSSPAFCNGAIIPSQHTCEGANINPPLQIDDVPIATKSLVLIMEDPDVPKSIRPDGTWNHWILFNIPPSAHRIASLQKPEGGISGKTTFGCTGYGGPCPPDREHRYFFYLYALDQMLPLREGASKQEVLVAMKGHIIDKAELMGRYEKGKGY
jgi:Raf kinase inhibitor-like YbhB/YbcL family protein